MWWLFYCCLWRCFDFNRRAALGARYGYLQPGTEGVTERLHSAEKPPHRQQVGPCVSHVVLPPGTSLFFCSRLFEYGRVVCDTDDDLNRYERQLLWCCAADGDDKEDGDHGQSRKSHYCCCHAGGDTSVLSW